MTMLAHLAVLLGFKMGLHYDIPLADDDDRAEVADASFDKPGYRSLGL